MKKTIILALALAGIVLVPQAIRAQFADAVISYDSGAGFATGYTNASAALGAPSSGGSVTPFAPPFSKNQLVSIGAGGEITLQLDTPISNNPSAALGINFILFANEFFVSSGGAVNGLFYHGASALVQVSADGSAWYTLNPSLTPQPGQLFPTDGSGNPQIPVNPSLTLANFQGQNLAGIRSLYGGSAGGAGYDLAWAQDAGGNSVDLPSADYVRIEVQSGVVDLDAISVVPEPSAWALTSAGAALLWLRRRSTRRVTTLAIARHYLSTRLGFLFLAILFATSSMRAATITENFSTDPLRDGWQLFGNTNLFRWDATNHELAVTWDSTQPNSYFFHPLPFYVTRHDDFTIEFDLLLSDIASGVEPGKTGPLELGFGFLHLAGATSTNFMRGDFGYAPNVAEFDYYAYGYYDFGGVIYPSPPTTTPAFISGTDSYDYAPTDLSVYDNELPRNQTVHVQMAYTASNQTAVVVLTTNGAPMGPFPGLVLDTSNGFSDSDDFQVDAFSISSYSSFGDAYDSILAHGSVANIVVTLPPPVQNVTGAFTNAVWQVEFASRINWLYTLERTTDFTLWNDVSPATAGNGTNLALQDAGAPADKAFYRVRARRP